MTPEEFRDEMQRIADFHTESGVSDGQHDIEKAHGMADDLMGHVLTELGYGEGVKVFDSMTKWYG